MIPASFQLQGATITVRVLPPSKWRHGKGVEGMWLPSKHRIDVLGGQDKTHMQRIFVHEAVHAILDFMNDPRARDEVFVDNLAGLFHQMWTSVTPRKRT